MIALTHWTRLTEPRGRLYRLTEDELYAEVSRPVAAACKGDLPGFALVEFRDNRRALCNARAMHGCGVDIDHGNVARAEVVRAFDDLEGLVYSTPSSRPDDRRWRVLLLFAGPLTDLGDMRRVIRRAQRRAPGGVDTGTGDPSRLWYYPWQAAAHWECARLGGRPIDAVAWAAEERERDERQRQAKLAIRFAPMPSVDGNYASRALARACNAIGAANEGDRHKTLAAEAFSIGTLVGAGLLEREQARAALDDASRRVFPPNREEERARTLTQQLAEGEKHPRARKAGAWT